MTDHKNLPAALAAFQAEMPTVHKGKKAKVPMKSGGSYSYDYADLADVSAAAMPLLTRHGLSFITRPEVGERGFVLTGVLMHVSGEKVEGCLPISGHTPQEMGSSLTYMRRYLLGCLTGVVTDADDDGQAAARGQQQAQQRAQQQAKRETRQATKPAQQDTGEVMSPAARGKLFALMGQAPGIGADETTQRDFLSDVLGREVGSRASLTQQEAGAAIQRLEAWASGDASAAWSPFGGAA